MKVVAIDTTAAACSVAAWADGQTLAWDRQAMARGHAEALLPMVRAVLGAAGLAPDRIDLVAVTVGPGAFTGIRIGLAAARGLALAGGVPCVGVTALEAIAAAVPDDERVSAARLLVAMDTKRDDVYALACTSAGTDCAAPVACSYDDLAALVGGGPVVVAGDAAGRAVAALIAAGIDARPSRADGLPDPRVVAALGATLWRPGDAQPPLPEPLYLRPPYATAPGR